jgi:predicted ester cyclase
MTEQERNKKVIRDFFDAVNRQSLDEMDQWFARDMVRHCQATPDIKVRSLQDFKDFLESDFKVCPDAKQVLQRIIAEEDLVAVFATYYGTQSGQMGPFPPSNKKFELDYSGMMRFEKGKVVEVWVTWDNLSALMQLGHFNPLNSRDPILS